MAGATTNRNADAIDVGPGLLYIAPIGTAVPTTPDTATWDVAWIELGYTDAGSEFKVEPTVDDVRVAEEYDAVRSILTQTNSTVQMALAQVTAYNLQVAFGGGTIATATGIVTFEPPANGTGLQFAMLGWAAQDGSEAIIWRKVQPNGSLDLKREAGAAKATIPVTFKVLAPGGTTKPWIWLADATAHAGPTQLFANS